jgi:hypothetical protein
MTTDLAVLGRSSLLLLTIALIGVASLSKFGEVLLTATDTGRSNSRLVNARKRIFVLITGEVARCSEMISLAVPG